ncbi:MAG: S1 family peptidase [Lacipirellulaceae bacterium]
MTRIVGVGLSLCVATLAAGASVCGPLGCPVAPPLGPPAGAQLPPLVGPVAEAARAMVRITHRAGSGASLGSGTIVATDATHSFVVTCAHFFDDGPGRTAVTLREGVEHAAEVIEVDRAHDLALLRTGRLSATPARVAVEPLSGELTACGFGPVGVFRAVRGAITGYSTASGAQSASVRISGAVRPGDSGGGVFDGRGLLVAVVWGARDGETYAMCGAPLRRVLARIVLQPTPSTPPADAPRGLVPVAPQAPTPSAPVARPADDAWRDDVHRRLDGVARKEDLAGIAEGWRGAVAGLEEKLAQVAAPAVAPLLISALGISGPIGLGIVAAGLLLRGRFRSRASSTRTIAIDTPPLPQRVVPETHYVPYEREEFARAHQWASEQLSRKFPGSVEWLAGLESLIKQKLNGGQ